LANNLPSEIKVINTTCWASSNTGLESWSGFSGLPSAFRHYSGYFANLGYVADWWSSTKRNAGIGREQNLGYIYSSANTYYAEKQDGFAIRCLKD